MKRVLFVGDEREAPADFKSTLGTHKEEWELAFAPDEWQAFTAGGGTRNASWTAADPGTDLPSSQTDHFPRGRSVSSAAPTRKLTQFLTSVSIGNFMTSR